MKGRREDGQKGRRGEREKGRRGEKKSSRLVSSAPGRPVTDSPRPPVPPSPRPPVPPFRPPRTTRSVPLITLLTDFGTADYFVGAMKGVILAINPVARIVDITHEIPPQDIEAAAFILLAAYPSFPARTIHVAVVDPGVGSARRPVLVEAGSQFFVGPDNGIFSYVCQREPDARIFELNNEDYFRQRASATFHGRDIFAPVAAALTTGVESRKLGRETETLLGLGPLAPEKLKNGALKARIIHIDHFGNLITNLTPSDLTTRVIEKGAYLTVNGTTIHSFRRFFSEQPTNSNELFGIWGSAGFLELAAMNSSAAKILKAKRGDTVVVTCH